MDWVELIKAAGILIAAVAAVVSASRASKASQESKETKQMVATVLQQLQQQQQQKTDIRVGPFVLVSEGKSVGDGQTLPDLKLSESPPSPEAEPPHADQVEASQ